MILSQYKDMICCHLFPFDDVIMDMSSDHKGLNQDQTHFCTTRMVAILSVEYLY